ncbi:MAG: amidase family protein, partial [Fibrobacterota bacterium]
HVLSGFDALLVPTAPFHPTLEQVEADPIGVNSRLGTYTNFANLADLSALALPGPFRDDGLPAGITLLAPAWHDPALADFGCRWLESLDQAPGLLQSVPTNPPLKPASSHVVQLAVVGAHLTGMPLNHQLVSRRSRLVKTCKTAPGYGLYALTGTVPPKPGLARTGGTNQIELEVWEIPTEAFGSFVAEVPPPLGIGNVQLEDGGWTKGFICEGAAIESGLDITAFGGWRAFVNRPQPAPGQGATGTSAISAK